MQKILTLVVAALLSVAATAQWKQLNPQPSGYANNAITFTDAVHGFLFNDNGELYTTSDTGNTWQLKRRFPQSHLFKLKDSTGIIAGAGVYISPDNGQTWQKKNLDSAVTSVEWVDIVHRDTLLIAAWTGAFRKLYTSVNRGNSWTTVNSTFPFQKNSVDFVTSKIGYASMPSTGIHKTTDGGVTWKNIYPYSTSAAVTCIQFADSLNGYAYRESDTMMRTNDGGKTWIKARALPNRVNAIFIVNANTAYAAGDYLGIYKTIDGGTNWTFIGNDQVFFSNYYSLYFFNGQHGFVAGFPGKLMKTTDGGASWKANAATHIEITGLSMASNSTGYASTWNRVFRTTNSGITWQQLPLVIGNGFADYSRINHCVFFNADTGVVTTDNYPYIFRTVNGGQTFDTIKGGLQNIEELTSLFFLNANTGYCNGRDVSPYRLFKTIDGGRTWKPLTTYSDLAPGSKIFFVDERYGYGLQYNRIVQSTDSGKTWSVSNFDFDTHYLSMWFFNAKKGFVTGEHAMLKATNDSGHTWTRIPFPDRYYNIDFLNIRFFSDSVGYITAENGYVLKTIDGGATWRECGKTAFSNSQIAFTSDSTVYIAGLHGNMLKNGIAEFQIDSLQVNAITSCSAGLSAFVMADLSTVDSIWFEFGVHGFDRSAAATPAGVTNGTIKAIVQAPNLMANTVYRLRAKLLYKGQYYYSEELSFITEALPVPVITPVNYQLTSSADSGNQWYRNDTLIAGATGKQYIADKSGIYKVQVIKGNCISSFSDAVTITITGIIDPVLNAELRVYPNPVTSHINIENDRLRRLSVTVTNSTGQQVLFLDNTRAQRITLPAGKLASGLYFIQITDLQTKGMVTRKLVKVQ